MVIGGADLYAQTLARAHRLEITRVHVEPRGDVTFPRIRPETWQETSRTEFTAGPGDEANFTVLTYERIGP
jgi:dihydrofolate reductase